MMLKQKNRLFFLFDPTIITIGLDHYNQWSNLTGLNQMDNSVDDVFEVTD